MVFLLLVIRLRPAGQFLSQKVLQTMTPLSGGAPHPQNRLRAPLSFAVHCASGFFFPMLRAVFRIESAQPFPLCPCPQTPVQDHVRARPEDLQRQETKILLRPERIGVMHFARPFRKQGQRYFINGQDHRIPFLPQLLRVGGFAAADPAAGHDYFCHFPLRRFSSPSGRCPPPEAGFPHSLWHYSTVHFPSCTSG